MKSNQGFLITLYHAWIVKNWDLLLSVGLGMFLLSR